MNKNVYLISPDYLKSKLPYINENIDNDLLDVAILEAQDIEIQNIIGYNLYNAILDKVENDTLSGDTIYNNLYNNYIENPLVYYAISRALITLQYKFNNKNIGIKSSENTEPIDDKGYNKLYSHINNTAQFYAERLINHLCYNEDLYPEFDKEQKEFIKPSKKSSYFQGLDLTSETYSEKVKRNCRRWWI